MSRSATLAPKAPSTMAWPERCEASLQRSARRHEPPRVASRGIDSGRPSSRHARVPHVLDLERVRPLPEEAGRQRRASRVRGTLPSHVASPTIVPFTPSRTWWSIAPSTSLAPCRATDTSRVASGRDVVEAEGVALAPRRDEHVPEPEVRRLEQPSLVDSGSPPSPPSPGTRSRSCAAAERRSTAMTCPGHTRLQLVDRVSVRVQRRSLAQEEERRSRSERSVDRAPRGRPRLPLPRQPKAGDVQAAQAARGGKSSSYPTR